MNRLRFLGLLLRPSAASIVLTFLITLLVLGIYLLTYASKTGIFYEFLAGPAGSAILIEEAKGTVAAFNQTVFGNPILNQVLFLAFWMLIGLIVYSFIAAASAGFSSVHDYLEQLRYVNVKKKQYQASVLTRLSLQLTALVIWGIYAIFFYKLILPFSLLSGRIGVSELSTVMGVGNLALGFVVLAASIHVHIVLLRLTSLRLRATGGWEDILTEDHSHNAR
ncbi:hypothetical protein BH23PAT1_BH23PAT1_3850 [soil metagenome]